MKQKVSDWIAAFLESKKVRHAFGIVGAGNAHLYDSLPRRGYTEIVCVHHEQAAAMAVQSYYRLSGVVGCALLTTGGGSINAMTGVLGAWMDSVPALILSGNENAIYTTPDNSLRAYGVQGYDSPRVAATITKHHTRVLHARSVLRELEKAHFLATIGRPGPVWVDIPMSVQAEEVTESDLERFDPSTDPDASAAMNAIKPPANLNEQVDAAVAMLARAERPLFWLGHGIRLAGAADLVPTLLERFRIPSLVSWSAIDLIDTDHPRVYGRAGTYGQRCANFVVQNCDTLVTIGTRLAIPQVGYDINEFARGARIVVVDIDSAELGKYKQRYDAAIACDAGVFLRTLLERHPCGLEGPQAWVARCDDWKRRYPWVDAKHGPRDGFINSYDFIGRLCKHFRRDQVVVTDMGTALTCTHQTIRVKPPQRLLTSQGLGEMGWGLPGSIGASFARGRGEVLCINGDGSMMLNLQELQTIAHHRLPIKVVIFVNDGYTTIKHTQTALFAGRLSGTNQRTGVSCPDFARIAAAFDIPCHVLQRASDFEAAVTPFLAESGPAFCLVHLHPEQPFVPKLSVAVRDDGTLVSPPLEDLSPLLPRSELAGNMISGLHPKSERLKP